MRYLIAVMILAVMITGCKKSEDTQTASSSAPAAQISAEKAADIPQNSVKAPLTPQQAATPGRILTQSVFTCEDKTSFTAQFKRNEVNILFPKFRPLVLQQQITASGFNYKSPQYSLRGTGKSALWQVAGKKPVSCVAK